MKDAILMMAIYATLGMVNAGVTLTLETETIKIGESMILTCTVHGISKINQNATRQFAKGNRGDLLCYNGQISQTRKYEEILSEGNKFSLMIDNVSESDVNSIYQCRYKFSTVKQMIGINIMNFEYGPTENTTLIEFNKYDNKSFEIQINFTKIFPVPICSAKTKTLDLKFANTSFMEDRMFYKVSIILMYAVDGQCDTDLEVYCTVGRSNHYIKSFQPFMECSDRLLIMLSTFTLFILLAVLVIVCYKKRRRKKSCKRNSGKPKKSKNEEEETCAMQEQH